MDRPLKLIGTILGIIFAGVALRSFWATDDQAQYVPEAPLVSNVATTTSTSNTAPSIHSVKPGDKVGDFTLADIDIFPFVYPDGQQDYTATYTGETTVGGEFWWSAMLDRTCFEVSAVDAYKIPRLAEDNKPAWFCFSNAEFAKQVFGLDASVKGDGIKHDATVTIRSYIEVVAGKEGSDSAELVRVGTLGSRSFLAGKGPESTLSQCFGEYALRPANISKSWKQLSGIGFVMQAPAGVTLTDTSPSSELFHRSFAIKDSTGHQVTVRALYFKNGDSLRLSAVYDPPVAFEPRSNTWWKEKWFDRPQTQCEPNPAATTIAGDPVYVTGASDVGSYYRDYTVIFTERLKDPISGYPEALIFRISGDTNAVDYAEFKQFEEIIEQMILTVQPVVNWG